MYLRNDRYIVAYLKTLFHLHRPNIALQYCTFLFSTLEVNGLNLGSAT
jgi:hypothetical protein